jgi:ketosteroid isomerase-like protein
VTDQYKRLPKPNKICDRRVGWSIQSSGAAAGAADVFDRAEDAIVAAAPREETMNDPGAIADRVEIEALRSEFADALMMHDYDRFASLFTSDGAWRIPYIDVEIVGREQIRAGIERMQGLWEYFVQTTHPGTIQLEGDTALGRAYILEFGHMRDGRSELNYSLYHDRYRRTPDGWKFTERVYEVRYLDTTALAGSAPGAQGPADPPAESKSSATPRG